MEDSSKKSGGARNPKRNRSLDLNSLYKPRVSKGEEEAKGGKVSQENDQQNSGKKKRRNKKEVALSLLEPDAKRTKKEDVNEVDSELESSRKSSGGSEGLHGISLSLGENSNAFNFPKRPRGAVGKKKLETDQVSNLLELPKPGEHEDAFNAKFKDEDGTSGEPVGLDSFSPGNDELPKSESVGKAVGSNNKSGVKVGKLKPKSRSVEKAAATKSKGLGKIGPKPRGKVASSDAELKQKEGSESDQKGISSNVELKLNTDTQPTGKVVKSKVKPKRKVVTDELKESGNGESESARAAAKEDSVAVNTGDASSKKRRTNNKKKKDSVGPDGGETSKNRPELSVGTAVSDKIVADFDEAGAEEESLQKNSGKDSVVAVSRGDASSKMRRGGSRKKKGLADVKDGGKASKEKPDHSVGILVSDKITSGFNEGDAVEETLEQNCGNENVVAVSGGDTSSKKRRPVSRRKKALVDDKDGGEASKKQPEPSVGILVSDKIVTGLDETDEKKENLEENSRKEIVVAVNKGDTSSKKRRRVSRKKKDVVESKDGVETSKKVSEESIGVSVSDKIVAGFDKAVKEEEHPEKNGRKENVAAVNTGDASSKKRRNRKRKDLVDAKDGGESTKQAKSSVDISVSDKIVADVDGDDGVANLKKSGGEESDVAVQSGDTSSKRRRINSKKKKDLGDGKDVGEALKKKLEPSVGSSVSQKAVAADFDKDNDEGSLKPDSGKESVGAIHSGDTSSKKRRVNSRKKKDLTDAKDGPEASKKSELSASLSVSDKAIAGFDEEDADEPNLKKIGRKKNVAAVNSRGTSSKKRQANSGKKKDLPIGKDGGEASRKKSEPSVGISISDKVVSDFDEDDDDEENLEQNAARMLSSRFDPSCTGFPSKRKVSASQKAIESPVRESSTLDSLSQQANSSGGVDVAPVGDDSKADDQSRALRPRKEDKGKGEPRKRRHFYDVPAKDLEPNWVLGLKIKVFWPLDESWYFGQVDDYHPECRLYHVKYDDRDEEWIDLNEERFKLLLFPSEVPGRDKSRKSSKAPKDVHKVETVQPAEDDNDIEADDSEPIASWLARSSQRCKSLAKSLKTRGTSSGIETVPQRSSEDTDHLRSKVTDPKGRFEADCESTSASKVIKSVAATSIVYARKRSQASSEGNGSVSRYVQAYGSASGTSDPVDVISISLPAEENVDSEKQVWSVDRRGRSHLNFKLVESSKLKFWIQLPSLPNWEFSVRTSCSPLFNDIFMAQHGVLLPTSPSVVLEMIFIDSDRGLNFFLFEGSMKQALLSVFEILIFFGQAGEIMDHDMQSPVTSIRFRFSGVPDFRKRHVFQLHSFSRYGNSKWVGLDSKLLQHSLLLKRLPASECTYDNIKELEDWSLKQWEPPVGLRLSSYTCLNKGILPSTSREAYTTRTSQSASYFSQKHGQVPPYVILSSAAPNFLLTQHLQVLIGNSSAKHPCQVNLHEENAESLPAAPIPSQASDHGSDSRSDQMIVDVSSADQVGVPHNAKEPISKKASDVARSVSEGFDKTPTPIGTRSSLQGGKNRKVSTTPADHYPKWTDATPKFMRRGFSSGPKKPRTLVEYHKLPGADHDVSLKQKTQNQRSVPGKRIKRDGLKRVSDATSGNRRNFDLVICYANVLVTRGDRGWRESGALIGLEVADHNEWRLAVKLPGSTKYLYKVNHILQPGSTNRYSHAVLWKGGKDWVLEFTDRSQWNLFKEMHEECYNRNVRAASVKNIPIPGVQPIEDFDDYGIEAPFVRNPMKYIRQLQNDVEMAMDPSHVLYDLDSDDEQWLMSNQECVDENGFEVITDDFLEKMMDIFEKASYVKHRDNFTKDELQELVAGLGSLEAAKLIYGHWCDRRGRKGMPLIRYLQPPLWEKYQQQMKEWESSVGRGNLAVTTAGIPGKAPVPEKPAMFAFCLKPRGLEIRNKSFKQRSNRKYPVSAAHLHPGSGNHGNFYIYGRRSNANTYDGKKALYRTGMHEPSDISPLPPSVRLLSPRDAHFTLSAAVSVASPSPRVYRAKRRKHGRHPATDVQQTSSSRRKKGRKGGANMGLPDSASPMDLYTERPGFENMINPDNLNECRLRDASAAARYAQEVAKHKRHKAQIMFEQADIALQRATAVMLTADAIKFATDSANGDS
ncbi:uncharacterized protein LOC127250651 [Andrographis paniculata]|uniref:uncharacterized protein LOC127250651 n=1 Tax=Andrographis paniculata TaxID=175694 RepID=UPI0021E720FD|nr:uncharacterized protein LOC127250651 [Andrographis paniculata]